MNIMMNCGLFTCCVIGLFFSVISLATEAPDKKNETFIVKQEVSKPMSRRQVKENIGEGIKDVLHSYVKFNKHVGKLQQEICGIEKHLFGKVERLADNQTPFKNASKRSLKDALQIMNDVNARLGSYIKSLKEIRAQVNKNYCLKERSR